MQTKNENLLDNVILSFMDKNSEKKDRPKQKRLSIE